MNISKKYVAVLILALFLVLFVSCPQDTTSVASFKDGKIFEFITDSEIKSDNTFVIKLNGYTFKDTVTSGTEVGSSGLGWISINNNTELSFEITEVSQDKTEVTVAISGTPSKPLSASVDAEIQKEYLQDKDGAIPENNVIVNTKHSKIVITVGSPKLYLKDKIYIEGEKTNELEQLEIV